MKTFSVFFFFSPIPSPLKSPCLVNKKWRIIFLLINHHLMYFTSQFHAFHNCRTLFSNLHISAGQNSLLECPNFYTNFHLSACPAKYVRQKLGFDHIWPSHTCIQPISQHSALTNALGMRALRDS